MTYTCGIVEDEPLAERMLRRYIRRISFLEIAWQCAFAEQAVDLMHRHPVDLLFLNLQALPVRPDSAFMLLVNTCKNMVVVVSGYSAEMVNVSLNVIAFLSKPFTFEQLLDTLEAFLGTRDG